MTDLLYYPAPGSQLSPRELLNVALTCRGADLDPYLDPDLRGTQDDPDGTGPADSKDRVDAARLMSARRMLANLAASGEIDLASGEDAALNLALLAPLPRNGAELAEALCEGDSGVSEVFADDETLERHLCAWLRPA